jgi:hypothetical protein
MRKNTENRSRFGGWGSVFFYEAQLLLDPNYPPKPCWYSAGVGWANIALTGYTRDARPVRDTVVIRAKRQASGAKAKRHMRALARAEFKAYQARYAKSWRSFD